MEQEKFNRLIEKQKENKIKSIQKRIEKLKYNHEHSLNFGIKTLKDEVRQDTWCTNHLNCFRASPSLDGHAESDEHIRKKFELWLEFRKLGYFVMCEIIFKSGKRADMAVIGNNGEIELIEIICTEKEQSIKEKEETYPFKVRFVRVEEKEIMI